MARVSINRSSSTTVTRLSASQEQMNDMIRKKAYELFEKRGRKQGHAMNDWLEAERIVKQKTF